VEIGDNIEVEEAASDEDATRPPTAAGSRRKNNRATAKGRNGKRNGNGSGHSDAEREVAPLGSGGTVRESDLRRLLAAIRELKEGDFDIRLPVSDVPLLADIAEEFNAVAKLNTRLCDVMTRVS
jgi:hypothetical protein